MGKEWVDETCLQMFNNVLYTVSSGRVRLLFKSSPNISFRPDMLAFFKDMNVLCVIKTLKKVEYRAKCIV